MRILRRLSFLLAALGFPLLIALIVWHRPGPGFDDVGSVAAVLGFAALAVAVYRLELAAGHRQARAAKAALDEYDARLPRLPKPGVSPVELGYLAEGERRSLLVTVFQLRQAGALAQRDGFTWGDSRLQRASGPLPPDADPMARVLHAAAQRELDLASLHRDANRRPAGLGEAIQAVVDRLEAAGLYHTVDMSDRFPRGPHTHWPLLLALLSWPVAVALVATDGWVPATLVLLVRYYLGYRTMAGVVYIVNARSGTSPAGEATVQAARTRAAAGATSAAAAGAAAAGAGAGANTGAGAASSAAEAVALFGEEVLATYDSSLADVVANGDFAERPVEFWPDSGGI
ncbi:hypothetical protein [Actinoplanes sp. DH11]|uniref:hypothetical protein n=1 Tax=Actinoplanes sp. DH11 TaxID=2857011 RepID=UPI001E5EEDD9|nr:hypothetical protein [Actinoplanes sp. DH11]